MKLWNCFAGRIAFKVAAAVFVTFLQTTWADKSANFESPSSKRVLQLIDAAPYAASDKKNLKEKLGGAWFSDIGNACEAARVSEETIDVQTKSTSADLEMSVAFISAVGKCLEQRTVEFMASPEFKKASAQDQIIVAACLQEAVEDYTARSLEKLFTQRSYTMTVPDGVERSVANPHYRQLLTLAAKTLQQRRVELARPTHHTVVVGDSVPYLARRYKVSTGALLAANPGIVSGLVRVGQVVFIPLPAAAPAKRAPNAE